MSGFEAVVERVRKHLRCTRAQARFLLVEVIGVEVAKQVLLREQLVEWHRLGTFRPHVRPALTINLEALKRAGHLHQDAPSVAKVPPVRTVRFRASRAHAQMAVRR